MSRAAAITLASLCAAGAVVYLTPSLKARVDAWVKRLWEGDLEAVAKEGTMSQMDMIEQFFKGQAGTLKKADADLKAVEADVQRDKEKAEAKAKAEAEAAAKAAGGEDKAANAAAANSYYHFSSDGKKFKNKWDSYDVDAELRALDGAEAMGERKSALRKVLADAYTGLWEAQGIVDELRGDEEVKQRRKALSDRNAKLMERQQKLQERFNAL